MADKPVVNVEAPATDIEPLKTATEDANKSTLKLIENTVDEKVVVTVFSTNVQKVGDQNIKTWGSISFGIKKPMGILQHIVKYKPPTTVDPKDPKKKLPGVYMDISHCVKVEATEKFDKITYSKINDAGLTGYTFTVTVENLGLETATFSGKFKQDAEEYDWTGDFVSATPETIQSTTINLSRPDDADPSTTLESLRTLTPFATKNSGLYKQGQDKAQVAGDSLMFQITMHALDQRTLDNFMPNLKPLDTDSEAILKDNNEYFHRCAVHILSEQLKTADKIKSQDWSKHIVYRYEQFQKTMCCNKKPDTGPDPVAVYGFDRDNTTHMQVLKSLQDQHSNVAMRCYQWGYKSTCPEWMPFLKTPTYWFKMYAAMLLSREYKERWLAQLVDKPEGLRISATEEVLMWGNKLSLLKANSPASDQIDMDPTCITETLLGEAQQKIALMQAVNDEALKHLEELLKGIEEDPTAKKIKDDFLQRQEDAAHTITMVKATMSDLARKLADPSSGLYAQITKYYERRLPPALQRSKWTVGHLINALDDEKFVEAIEAAGELPMPVEEATLTVGGRIKGLFTKDNFKKAMKGLFQGALHTLAIGLSAMALMEGGKKLHAFEIAQISLTLAAEGLGLLGMGVRRLITWGIARVKGWTRTIAFFFNVGLDGIKSLGRRVVGALVGNLSKVIRLIGLVGCVFSIVTAYWDIQKAKSMGQSGKALYIYSITQMVIGILEAVIIVGEIICEVFAIGATFMAMSGPACIVLAVIGLIAALIYFIWFAPDPYADVRFFLDNEGKNYGSYDEGKTVDAIEPPKDKEKTDLRDVLTGGTQPPKDN